MQLLKTRIKLKLRKAIDIVLNEAESSALGENNEETQKAITLVHDFLYWVADDVAIWDEMTSDGYEIHDFLYDSNKMKDFDELSKEEFLKKYPFVKEGEYNITRMEQKKQKEGK